MGFSQWSWVSNQNPKHSVLVSCNFPPGIRIQDRCSLEAPSCLVNAGSLDMCRSVFIDFSSLPVSLPWLSLALPMLWIWAPAEIRLLTQPFSEHIIIRSFCQPSVFWSHFHCLLLLFAVVICISPVYTHLLKLIRSSTPSGQHVV